MVNEVSGCASVIEDMLIQTIVTGSMKQLGGVVIAPKLNKLKQGMFYGQYRPIDKGTHKHVDGFPVLRSVGNLAKAEVR